MFSIQKSYKSTKVINSGSSPSFYSKDVYNNLIPQTLFFQNNTQI